MRLLRTVSGAQKPPRVLGRAGPCPGSSDLNFLGDLKGIIDFDTKIPLGAFQSSNGPARRLPAQRWISVALIRRQGMRGELARVEIRRPTCIRAEHTAVCSKDRSGFRPLGTGTRQLCTSSGEASCRGPVAWAQLARSEQACRSFAAGRWPGPWHTHGVPNFGTYRPNVTARNGGFGCGAGFGHGGLLRDLQHAPPIARPLQNPSANRSYPSRHGYPRGPSGRNVTLAVKN